jgi:Helix-turn-helix domain
MDAAEQDSSGFVTPKQFAAMIHVDPQTVYRMFDDGCLPGLRARRAIRIPEAFASECARLADRGQVDVAQFGRQWQARATRRDRVPLSVLPGGIA